MIPILVLSLPAFVLVCIRKKIFRTHMSVTKFIATYMAGALILNYAAMIILLLVFQNTGRLIYKLNTYHGFAVKYFILSLVIAVAEPLAEKHLQNKWCTPPKKM